MTFARLVAAKYMVAVPAKISFGRCCGIMCTCQGGAPALASVEVKPRQRAPEHAARNALGRMPISPLVGPNQRHSTNGRADHADREPHRCIRHIGREQSRHARRRSGRPGSAPSGSRHPSAAGRPSTEITSCEKQDRQHDGDRLQRRHDQRKQRRRHHADAGEAALGEAKQRHGDRSDDPEQRV